MTRASVSTLIAVSLMLIQTSCGDPTEVQSSAIQVGASVTPREASVSRDTLGVAIVVRLTNPSGHPVSVSLDNSTGENSAYALGAVISDSTGHTVHTFDRSLDATRLHLKPTEEMDVVFRLGAIGEPFPLPPGRYQITTEFGGQRSAAISLVVTP